MSKPRAYRMLTSIASSDGWSYSVGQEVFSGDRYSGDIVLAATLGGWVRAGIAEPVPGAPQPPAEQEQPEQPEPEQPEPEAQEPEMGAAAEGEQDGWPDGYTWERSGNWFLVRDRADEVVASDSPSGKWNGEDAAQEAAWQHERQQRQQRQQTENDQRVPEQES